MRKPDSTLIFGSSTPPASVQSPTSVRAPVSLRAPVSRQYEKQWFDKPVEPPPASIEPLRPVGGDLQAERRGFVPRNPERGLAFAAIALTLIGIAGAGTYFFFGIPDTAHTAESNQVGTTTVTNADLPPATAPAPATPPAAPAAEPKDLSWTPPVVDAVKSPNLPKQLNSPQQLPTERSADTTTPSFNTVKTVPTAHQVPANAQQEDDANRAAAGFYPNYVPNPGDNSVTPPPIQRMPSAGSEDVTTHMTPDNTDNTMHNPQGEPSLPQGIKQ